MTTTTPPAAPPDPLRDLALDWARRPEIARALARAEEDGDTFGVYLAGFTAGREAENGELIAWADAEPFPNARSWTVERWYGNRVNCRLSWFDAEGQHRPRETAATADTTALAITAALAEFKRSAAKETT